jgi:hypothetical protein
VNLLLLDPSEVRDDGTALLTGRRHEHARAVLRVQAGEEGYGEYKPLFDKAAAKAAK